MHGLVQEKRKTIANALELRLSCPNTSMYTTAFQLRLYRVQRININTKWGMEISQTTFFVYIYDTCRICD